MEVAWSVRHQWQWQVTANLRRADSATVGEWDSGLASASNSSPKAVTSHSTPPSAAIDRPAQPNVPRHCLGTHLTKLCFAYQGRFPGAKHCDSKQSFDPQRSQAELWNENMKASDLWRPVPVTPPATPPPACF